MMDLLAFILAAIWGAIWAAFLQFSALGRFLAVKRTWITVVVGVGMVLAIGLINIPWAAWWRVATLIVLSSLAIIFRSLHNEWAEMREELHDVKNAAGQQDHLGA